MNPGLNGRRFGGVVLFFVLALAGCSADESVPNSSPSGSDSETREGALRVLSNRADLVSGGDALIEVIPPAGVEASTVNVERNGSDVSSAFAKRADGHFVGLVTGLKSGENIITARVGSASMSTTLVNHPSGGPVFSGPQLQPWTCRNEGAQDAQCNQPPEYRYFYKSSDPNKSGFQPYDPAAPATDVAQTTTDTGVTVPFIVRRELGYIDRDQYQVAALYQPDMPWTAAEPQPQFNHKLLVNHGFGCGVEYQTAGAPSVIPGGGTAIPVVGGGLPIGTPIPILVDATETALAAGYAVMSNALDNSSHNCNVAVQAESLLMTKERVVEQYGELRYTIGEGCSGGSLAVQWIANAYPGIYQGILPTCSFPDAWSTATQFADYHLTLAYFQDPSKWGPGVVWSPTQMADVQGHVTIANAIVSDAAQFHVVIPTHECGGISAEQRYHPQTNPGGVRCSVIDAAINLFGPRPPEVWTDNEKTLGRGFGGIAVDNTGVQYGLGALQTGRILPSQFIDLNVKMGGLDIDINPIPGRTSADEPALSNAYRTGMINVTNNLDRTAIIDCRGPDPGLFHDSYRAYAVRARLDREHGDHDNQLIWEGPAPIMGDNSCAVNSFKAMDRWLAAVEQDTSSTPLPQKIVANKPADLKDACYSGVGVKLADGLCPKFAVPGFENLLNIGVVPVYGTPRMVAGDSIATDTNKCQLKPLNRADSYGFLPFSDAEWAQMEALFPDGVCDFSRPGVSHQGTIPWQTYQNGNGGVIYGGRALPATPANSGNGWASPAFGVATGD